jgi:hypothetical protein
MTRQGSIRKTWRDWRRTEAEVAAFPAAELDGLGLTRAALRAVAHMPAAQADRMEQVAELFGIAPWTLAGLPALRSDAAVTCAQCRVQASCHREMTAPRGTSAARMAFCPNAPRFQAQTGD